MNFSVLDGYFDAHSQSEETETSTDAQRFYRPLPNESEHNKDSKEHTTLKSEATRL